MNLRRCYWAITIMMSFRLSQPSRVIDSSVTKGIYVSDYCPFMKGCTKPGIHVMCLKNPNVINWFGPHCHEAKNITVTDQISLRLLTIVNAIRRKVALGIEKGKDGRYFPRGYGVWRLEWDNELATFAQVWANQCLFQRDLCRSTDRFPNPSQSLGLVRFTYPDWTPITTSWPGNGFQPQIIVHAVIQTVKKWYTMKNSISVEEMDSLPQASVSKPYLNMVSGHVTHMGCGISAFTEYSYNSQDVDLLYNSVLLVCNFSTRLTAGTAVYNTTPPTSSDFSKCGCPKGSKEDGDCLCYPAILKKNCTGAQCDPTVVLLPIFTVEDAPPGHIPRYSGFQNNSKFEPETAEMDNIFETDVFSNKTVNEGLSESMNSLRSYPDLFDITKQRGIDRKKYQEPNGADYFNLKTRKASANSKSNLYYNPENPSNQLDGISSIRRQMFQTNIRNNLKTDTSNNDYFNEKGERFSLLNSELKDDSVNKLTEILRKLQQAVNYVGLDDQKKQLLDEKIKEIYAQILQKMDKKKANTLKSRAYDDNDNNDSNKHHRMFPHDARNLGNEDTNIDSYKDLKSDCYLNADQNDPSKTVFVNRNDNNRKKRPIFEMNSDTTGDVPVEQQFVFKNRVVKDDVIDLDRRMYYQKQLEDLKTKMYTYHHQTSSSSRDKNFIEVTKRRPTIN